MQFSIVVVSGSWTQGPYLCQTLKILEGFDLRSCKLSVTSRGHLPSDPKHGGYRRLKSFQVASLVYDATVIFCDRFISKRSRTHDQMVQAARSGRQNIAEGSAASGTSKKFELKLTRVSKASLEELLLGN